MNEFTGVLKRLLYVLALPALFMVGMVIYVVYPVVGYILGRGLQSSIDLVVEVLTDTFEGTYGFIRAFKKLYKGDIYA